MLFLFYKIIFRILVFLLFEEDAADAFQLHSRAINETAKERAVAEGAIACHWTGFAVMNKGYAAVFLQLEGKRTVFATADVGADFFLASIVGIEGEGHSTDAKLRALEMLDIQECVADKLKEPKTKGGMILIWIITPEATNA